MAFTTIPGASATDATSFIGTEGVDILNSFATITGFVEALGFSDTITLGTAALAGANSLADWTVRAGNGLDSLSITAQVVGGLYNGNQAADTITTRSIFGGARILGGMDNDTITVNGDVVSSSVNGNKGTDKVFVSGGLLSASVFGGQGADMITVAASGPGNEASLISGDFGNDTIKVGFKADGETLEGGATLSTSTVDGGEGNDTIVIALDGASTTDVLTIIGGLGNDTIAGGATTDSISGGEGDDLISAGAGDDTISGDEGKDTIAGGAGDDTVTGGAGDDNLVVGGSAALTIGEITIDTPGDGIDVVTGGAGVDTFWGKSASSGTTDAPTWDKIVDFVKGTDVLVSGTGAAVNYTSYATSFATVKDLLAATLDTTAELNVAVGSTAAGFSSFIVGTNDAGRVATIAQLGADGVFDEFGARTNANIVVA